MSSPGGSGTTRVLPVTVPLVSCESTTTTCTGNHDDVSGVSRASRPDFEETRMKDSVSYVASYVEEDLILGWSEEDRDGNDLSFL